MMKKKESVATNAKKANEDGFKKMCEETGVPATKRQASKFNRGKGVVYRTQVLKHKEVPLPGENKKKRRR